MAVSVNTLSVLWQVWSHVWWQLLLFSVVSSLFVLGRNPRHSMVEQSSGSLPAICSEGHERIGPEGSLCGRNQSVLVTPQYFGIKVCDRSVCQLFNLVCADEIYLSGTLTAWKCNHMLLNYKSELKTSHLIVIIVIVKLRWYVDMWYMQLLNVCEVTGGLLVGKDQTHTLQSEWSTL